MKNFSLVFFVLAVLILAGAGCYKETSAPSPETNILTINVPATNDVVVPTNENISPPANVNQPAEESPKTATVLLQNFSFSPPSVTIAAGGEVTWTNRDSANHTVTGEDWGSEPFGKDKSFTKKFDAAGVYPYHCTLHPSMTGRVIVK